MKNLKNITLEMSLKPFKSVEQDYVEQVCRKMFDQWRGLLKHADMVSVMLWSSDGSEILDYKGKLDEEMEWAKYIGGANPRTEWDKKRDPEGIGLHTKYYLYMDKPPVITYRTLRRITDTIKKIGKDMTGKPVRVGATFDPGPEFAKSDFKYNRHEEICMGDAMGVKSFVCSYTILHEDKVSYAGFPDGIPEGTPLATFLGRQSNFFLKDMGFDYLWLSNGFGFGTENWGTTGVIYDGEQFHKEKINDTQQRILGFWKLFREECPDFPIETRGTNLTAGIDLSTDAVPLKDIYDGGFNILPPPNSPWAALDGDFGLELAGFMSRIAELPSGDDFLYRFYVHDPWWMNSPWLDRYEGQPHDIYLPLATVRINEAGNMESPNFLNLLTVDNSWGEMPDQCPNEVIPHLLKAYERKPDAPSPFVWVYPFRQYQEIASTGEQNVEKAFFEDWFIRGAINNGFPLSSIVSADNFISTSKKIPDIYKGSVMVSPVPLKDSEWEASLINWVENGGRLIVYGSVRNAGSRLLDMLNLHRTAPVEGEMELELNLDTDGLKEASWPQRILHRVIMSDGEIDTVVKDIDDKTTKVLAATGSGDTKRHVAVYRNCGKWKGGSVTWLRGTNSNSFQKGQYLLIPDNETQYFPMESLMRLTLSELGYDIRFSLEGPRTKKPVIMIHRNDGAFFFSGYVPDTTVEMKFRFPLGAPILMGSETKLSGGYSVYRMPRAWRSECRVFVEQEEDTTLSSKEVCSVSYQMKRRISLTGLKNATVRFFPQRGCEESTEVLLNSQYPYIFGDKMDLEMKDTEWGKVIEVIGVTGELMISTKYAL